MQFPKLSISSEASYPAAVRGAGLVIGGGATTRSAAHALTLLGLSPIFLINRDVEEVRVVQASLPHLTEKGSLIHLRSPDDVEKYLAQPDSVRILVIVGAIREFSLAFLSILELTWCSLFCPDHTSGAHGLHDCIFSTHDTIQQTY